MRHDTVDGRNPAPCTCDVENPVNNGITCLATGAGFLPSTVFCRKCRIDAEIHELPLIGCEAGLAFEGCSTIDALVYTSTFQYGGVVENDGKWFEDVQAAFASA